MASPAGFKRLTKEYQRIQTEPVPYIVARPTETNILEWYYVITGPPDTEYEGGQFLGQVVFPSQYPYSPPGIRMLTPNGRFLPDHKLCLSISDFHPESWNPSWGMGTILTGLLSFMTSTEMSTGCDPKTTVAGRRKLAAESHNWNASNPIFKKWFDSREQVVERTITEKTPSSVAAEADVASAAAAASSSKTASAASTSKPRPSTPSAPIEIIDLEDSPKRVKKKKKSDLAGDSEFEPILLD